MELKEALLKRRSCRKFLNKKVEDNIVKELMMAAMSGPSACNKKPWKFFIVTNEEKLAKLRFAGRSFNFNSPMHIVVCGDTTNTVTNKVEDYWIQDCSSSIENILLMATSLGLGTCWCGVFPMEDRIKAIREILNIDETLIPLGLIHVGYPDCELEERTQYDESNVFYI
ncbi:MAG: nitroreductase family protein [Erysipelotrichaceae bacterium]|nr:nitroreductase family protein [Erysipelotrichaceae bacterium]